MSTIVQQTNVVISQRAGNCHVHSRDITPHKGSYFGAQYACRSNQRQFPLNIFLFHRQAIACVSTTACLEWRQDVWIL
jgi:hypothetical protein